MIEAIIVISVMIGFFIGMNFFVSAYHQAILAQQLARTSAILTGMGGCNNGGDNTGSTGPWAQTDVTGQPTVNSGGEQGLNSFAPSGSIELFRSIPIGSEPTTANPMDQPAIDSHQLLQYLVSVRTQRTGSATVGGSTPYLVDVQSASLQVCAPSPNNFGNADPNFAVGEILGGFP
jgi:hypothetical protein